MEDIIIKESWKIIAPFWPLKNLIAINPLQGLEDLPFEEALTQGSTYFRPKRLPESMEIVNRETIKWLQVFLDEGQATISMPMRSEGFYKAWKKLAIFDNRLKSKNREISILELSDSPKRTIFKFLSLLGIKKEEQKQFLTLLLTTLPGWASYIKYHTEWTSSKEDHPYIISQEDYLAVRIIITYLLWPQASDLVKWHESLNNNKNPIKDIEATEKNFRLPLLKKLVSQTYPKSTKAIAQLVFCIDVRSEPFRKSLEEIGNYETYGFAGFFGIPVKIKDSITGDSYSSCPVLLQPKHEVTELYRCSKKENIKYQLRNNLKIFYQSLKYNFTTAFALVETIGFLSGIWMFIRNFMPKLSSLVNDSTKTDTNITPSLDHISLSEQCLYAESALRMIGLTKNFSKLVILCGHGSSTSNNAFATALDCGACGGRHGASNARIMASILNKPEIRKILEEKQILIPMDTIFIAAEHNTTSDEVRLYNYTNTAEVLQIKRDFEIARDLNSKFRCSQMSIQNKYYNKDQTKTRSIDWSQPRPEWGLSRNGALIVAPRNLTKNINLEGRCFLHSYDYQDDIDGNFLESILTAPMIVAQWINAQYLFSTLDNVAYGAGSKITKNITGKIGIMQGNASDLMTGLPLQSVYTSDKESYHEVQRLMTVVYAPRVMIDKIIIKQDILIKLFGNGWVKLCCIEPSDNQIYFLKKDMKWEKAL